MNALPFQPTIFRIKTSDIIGNEAAWDLLTVDGETPNETIYFMCQGDTPSSDASDAINRAIEAEEWEMGTLEQFEHTLSDFQIDASVFETAGEGYAVIRERLNIL